MSDNRVEIVPVTLEPHPNADQLSIVRVYGYSVVVRTADWKTSQLGAFVPPDSVVSLDRPEFAFLTNPRITVRRFRGIMSHGLLVPAPAGLTPGNDAAEALGVTHYEPAVFAIRPGSGSGPPPAPAPPGTHRPTYDVENLLKYGHLLRHGEDVIVTEKLHGANARYTVDCVDLEMHAGSRNQWKIADGNDPWWRAIGADLYLQEFILDNPGITVYGELYGDVQDLKYGCKQGELLFAAFDILDADGSWMPWSQAYQLASQFGVPWVPVLYTGPYDPAIVEELADGQSALHSTTVREGVVVTPVNERYDDRIGRVKLKRVSDAYLERAR